MGDHRVDYKDSIHGDLTSNTEIVSTDRRSAHARCDGNWETGMHWRAVTKQRHGIIRLMCMFGARRLANNLELETK